MQTLKRKEIVDGREYVIFYDPSFEFYEKYDVTGLISPIVCAHCLEVYDLTAVKTVHRFADCTVFRCPHCDQLVDDRQYKSIIDFKRI